MKKKMKKLVLSKETVQNLDANLGKAVGATTPDVGCTGVVCGYSDPYYCPRKLTGDGC